jgi:hypothetical protein
LWKLKRFKNKLNTKETEGTILHGHYHRGPSKNPIIGLKNRYAILFHASELVLIQTLSKRVILYNQYLLVICGSTDVVA